MSPDEHKAEAERLVAPADNGDDPSARDVARAQVHATLATIRGGVRHTRHDDPNPHAFVQ